MTIELINDMYLLAVKSKLNRGAISTEEKLNYILDELKTPVSGVIPQGIELSDGRVNVVEKEVPASVSQVPECDELGKFATKYSQGPEGEDNQAFSNRGLQSESDEDSFYELKISEDGTKARFSLIANAEIAGYITSYPRYAPPYAVEQEGMGIGNTFSVTKEGTLEREGRYWKIKEKCHIKWS